MACSSSAWSTRCRPTTQGKLEVAVLLTNDISANDKDCAQQPCAGLRSALETTSGVESVVFENRDKGFERFKRIFEAQPELLKLARPEAIPATFRVKLEDPERTDVIKNAFTGKAGVKSVDDQGKFLERFFEGLNGVRDIALILALVQAFAALLLISNTIQVSAFTRRTEVGIMRLVGATRWYTQLPFLIEAVVAGIVGAVVAVDRAHAGQGVLPRPDHQKPDRVRDHPAARPAGRPDHLAVAVPGRDPHLRDHRLRHAPPVRPALTAGMVT